MILKAAYNSGYCGSSSTVGCNAYILTEAVAPVHNPQVSDI